MNLKELPLGLIRENPAALRQVDRRSESYVELVDSVREKGILNPIVVRPIIDEESGEELYGLVDGLHRYSSAQDAGLETVPANVIPMEDADVLESQVIGNIHRVETKPVEYSQQLQRILAQNPTLTVSTLAAKLAKSKAWVSERLGLLKLHESVQPLVDSGQINLSNAFVLAKLPEEEQVNFVDQAQVMSAQEFSPTILNRKKELDKARRAGRDTTPAEFTPVPHLQKVGDVKSEFENPKVGPVLVREHGCETAEDGFAMAVKWMLHMDPTSIEIAKERDAERKRALQEKRDRAKKEREARKAEEAAVRAARIRVELEAKEAGKDVEAALAEFDEKHNINNE